MRPDSRKIAKAIWDNAPSGAKNVCKDEYGAKSGDNHWCAWIEMIHDDDTYCVVRADDRRTSEQAIDGVLVMLEAVVKSVLEASEQIQLETSDIADLIMEARDT